MFAVWAFGVRDSGGTVYVTVDNHSSNDYRNFLFQSTDFGQTWTSLVNDLPANRVLRTVREDPRNRSVLYLGTEFGLFYTNDGGRHWLPLAAGLQAAALK